MAKREICNALQICLKIARQGFFTLIFFNISVNTKIGPKQQNGEATQYNTRPLQHQLGPFNNQAPPTLIHQHVRLLGAPPNEVR